MSIDTSFSIQVTQSVPMFQNTMFAAQRAKDALVDRFRKKQGNRPSVGREDPDITFFIHLSHINLQFPDSSQTVCSHFLGRFDPIVEEFSANFPHESELRV